MPDEDHSPNDEDALVQKLSALIDDGTHRLYDTIEFLTFLAGPGQPLDGYDAESFSDINSIVSRFHQFETDRNGRRIRRAAKTLVKLSHPEPVFNVLCKKIELLQGIDGDLRTAQRAILRYKLRGLQPGSDIYHETRKKLLAHTEESPLVQHWAGLATLREFLVGRAVRVVMWVIRPLRAYLRVLGINVRLVIATCLNTSTRPGPAGHKRLEAIRKRLWEVKAKGRLNIKLPPLKESTEGPPIVLSKRANILLEYVLRYVEEKNQLPTYDDMELGAEMSRKTVSAAKRELVKANRWPVEKYKP